MSPSLKFGGGMHRILIRLGVPEFHDPFVPRLGIANHRQSILRHNHYCSAEISLQTLTTLQCAPSRSKHRESIFQALPYTATAPLAIQYIVLRPESGIFGLGCAAPRRSHLTDTDARDSQSVQLYQAPFFALQKLCLSDNRSPCF